MDSFKFEHFLALLNFIIFLIQVIIRSEIKRLDEKLGYFEERVKTLENKVYQVKHDNRNN